ncbi:MAG: hypothetical protein Q9162_006297 [Coniocarpon cinnabarinum]
MSATIYDTAWIACVIKPNQADAELQWLFPSAFAFVLDKQHSDGGWHWPPYGQECPASTLLSSLAALFMLKRHQEQPLQLAQKFSNVEERVRHGARFVETSLRHLSHELPKSVGFEVLAPALLDELQGFGLRFSFDAKKPLYAGRDAKLSKLAKANLEKFPHAALHSLEAFYARPTEQFSHRLRARLLEGSMMASPSATAAYLIRSDTWDESAEAYLRLAISNSEGACSGSVPSAFPSTNFELIWVISTVLQANCLDQNFLNVHRDQLLKIFETQVIEDGLAGFAPGMQADADDSARASIVLSLLGKQGLSHKIRARFESTTSFETFSNEANGSVSANCNVLMALLLDLHHGADNASAIVKVVTHLTSQWLGAEAGKVSDKWNVSEYYPDMLLAQAIVKALVYWEAGQLTQLDGTGALDDMILVAFRLLVRLLITQNKEGSWGSRGAREETSYAILALTNLAGLQLATFLKQQIHAAFDQGRQFLETSHPDALQEPEFLWVEKVLYASSNLSEAYRIAILQSVSAPLQNLSLGKDIAHVDAGKMAKFAVFSQKIPMLAREPRWLTLASWLEGQLFLPKLKEVRSAVASRIGWSKDQCFQWIPTMWTLANNVSECSISATLMLKMMKVSLFNFQADEIMESQIRVDPEPIIDAIFCNKSASVVINGASTSDHSNADDAADEINVKSCVSSKPMATGSLVNRKRSLDQSVEPSASKRHQSKHATEAVEQPMHNEVYLESSLQSFKAQIASLFADTHDGSSLKAHDPQNIPRSVLSQLHRFFCAHLIQSQLNEEFVKTRNRTRRPGALSELTVFRESEYDFRAWLDNVFAIHTSCPYSFKTYFAFVDMERTSPVLETARHKHVITDVCTHLSRMCRLYNDNGSLARDMIEGNLNCVNFPEFHDGVAGLRTGADSTAEMKTDEERLKAQLMELASWERKCLENAMVQLDTMEETSKELMGSLKVFVAVTDLFGQVYVVQDLASRRKE